MSDGTITPIAGPGPIDAIAGADPIAPPSEDGAAGRPADRTARPNLMRYTSTRRTSSDAARPRTTISAMVVNLDASRVALIADDGPPYRGYIDTDLATGAYHLTVDRNKHLWVFAPREVKSGLRFSLWIDGPDPFTLAYAEPLILLVTRGIDARTGATLASTVKALSQAVHDQDYQTALGTLCQLNVVDLYDVIDEMSQSGTGVAADILLHFQKTAMSIDAPGEAGVLRALESFSRPAKEIFVDAFDEWFVDPKSFSKDAERERAGLTNIQLSLRYDLSPPRALTVYADDITDNDAPASGLPRYGPGCLTYPTVLSKGTTPRLYQAKLSALKQIETQNSEFIKQAFQMTAEVLLSVFQASASVAKIAEAEAARSFVASAERGPGAWRATFEGGSNMSEAAERYELTSCGTPRGMGYYVDNVQFEGFRNGKLLDAKFWTKNGYYYNTLRRGVLSAGWKVVDQAERQLVVAEAHGVAIEWRVASEEVADILREMFRVHGFKISVVYIAPL